jgi:uncharacterized protein YjiS (DUF1127 family)
METLKSILGTIGGRFQAWRERERAYAELSALDDHTLADLGLRRSDIARVVYASNLDGERFDVESPIAANTNSSGRRAA